MYSLIPGVAVSNIQGLPDGGDVPFVTEPHLVLYVNTRLNRLVMIPTTARHKSGRHYFVGPRIFDLDTVEIQINGPNPVLSIHDFKARSATNWTDDELNQKFKRRGQSESIAVTTLNMRWALIEPLIASMDRELLFDPEHRRPLVQARAREALADPKLVGFLTSRTRKTQVKNNKVFDESPAGQIRRVAEEIKRCLAMFWAGGSVRGALIGFGDARGGRGKAKKAGPAKRGRPNAGVKEGRADVAGLNVEANSRDAKTIKFCYDTWVIRGTTVATALRRMWTEFYSVTVQQSDGSTKNEWLPVGKRPTASQFVYWGTKGDAGAVAWKKHLPPTKFDKNYRAVMGSASDDVYAVGQRGGIDSTPPDLQFVRAIDRLARVGGGHRIIVVDAMFGYIPGLYMGFDPPSATTVRLALYNAMDPNKREWLEDLSLDQELPAEDFIPLWFENLWADNTDLRNEEIKSCAHGIGTNIHFVPKMRSDLNSLAESGHHILHRLVDHKLAGSTGGKPKERGEASATDRARHTMLEGIREVVRAIHFHNTAKIEDNRTLRLRLKNVPPTRVAMTREMIRLGRVARTHHAIELGRRQLLPTYTGTFTAKGVRLHRPHRGEKVEFINHIVYVSPHPLISKRCEEARRGGKIDPAYFRASFYVDPYRPRRIWYVDLPSGEPIELTLVCLEIRDVDLPFVMTIPDMLNRDQVEASERIELKDARERKMGAVDIAQRNTGAHAEAAYQESLSSLGRTPSKSELRRAKRENREAEKTGCLFGIPIPEHAQGSAHEMDGQPSTFPHPDLNEDRRSASGNTSSPPVNSTENASEEVEHARPQASLLRAAVAKLSTTK